MCFRHMADYKKLPLHVQVARGNRARAYYLIREQLFIHLSPDHCLGPDSRLIAVVMTMKELCTHLGEVAGQNLSHLMLFG